MDPMTLLGIAFMLICVLFIFLLVAISKINSLHKKVTDVSPKDLYPFMEELRELVIESERVADKLEDAVRKKEEMLEDIAALLDEKLKRLETIQDDEPVIYTPSAQMSVQQQQPKQERRTVGGNMRSRIAELVDSGLTDSEIAAKLGISTTEVQLVKRMDIG